MKYISIERFAELVDLSPTTVRRMISRGEIRARRLGRMIRIPESELDKPGKPVTTTGRGAA